MENLNPDFLNFITLLRRASEGSTVDSTLRGAGVDFTVMNESSPLRASIFVSPPRALGGAETRKCCFSVRR